MNIQELPIISVIIPCYNGEQRIGDCLESIKRQRYPEEKIEIIVVDDDSTDNTVKIAREKYGCKIVRNGTHNIERGKSIGVEEAKGEYIFLIDDDNQLPGKNWLATLVRAVVKEGCVGGQASYFHYDKNDSMVNRYAALFAINDPTVFYLNRRDKLMHIERTWTLPGEVVFETEKFYKIKFTPETLLTIGSQGFLIKKEYLMRASWRPYLYHMDTNMELVMQGLDTYIMLKTSVIHDHSKDVRHFISKLKRNISLFYSENKYRKFKYDINKAKMFKLGIIMGTFIIPFKDSIQGYRKVHDIAWFLHPVISFRVALIYALSTIRNKLNRGGGSELSIFELIPYDVGFI